jgi:glycosyltransferase involved in cell wall biosynthesis
MPHEATDRLMAPGLRLAMWVKRLQQAGHQVVVGRALFEQVTLGAPAPSDATLKAHPAAPCEVRPLAPGDVNTLRQWVAAEPFDAVIANTDAMALLTARACLPVPLCVDYNGDPINEMQLQGWRAQNDAAILDAAHRMVPALLAGDAFTTCSAPHRHALLGQLGLVGRLNRFTAGHELVYHARSSWPLEFPAPPADAPPHQPLRGRLVPHDAFIVLWSGGYNNWADIDTLFKALHLLFDVEPRAHFVSTGGAIPGHGETVFEEFREWVEDSPQRQRFHFLGWVPTHHVPALYREADVALNLDVPSHEGELGSRHRALDWAAHGCVPVTTVQSELVRELVAAGAGVEVPMTDPPAVAEQLVRLALDPARRASIAQRGEDFARRWVEHAVDASFLEWVASPRRAPDLPPLAERPSLSIIRPDNPLASYAADAFPGRAVERHRADRGSRLYRHMEQLRDGLAKLRGRKRP